MNIARNHPEALCLRSPRRCESARIVIAEIRQARDGSRPEVRAFGILRRVAHAPDRLRGFHEGCSRHCGSSCIFLARPAGVAHDDDIRARRVLARRTAVIEPHHRMRIANRRPRLRPDIAMPTTMKRRPILLIALFNEGFEIRAIRFFVSSSWQPATSIGSIDPPRARSLCPRNGRRGSRSRRAALSSTQPTRPSDWVDRQCCHPATWCRRPPSCKLRSALVRLREIIPAQMFISPACLPDCTSSRHRQRPGTPEEGRNGRGTAPAIS